MKMSESIDKLAPALVKVQALNEGAVKKSTNPHFRSTFANLESVIEATKDLLFDNGLAVFQNLDDNGVTTILMHASGQWISTHANLACKDLSDPQKVMAAFTYFRRGNLAGATGTPQVDDDGNSAAQSAEATQGAAPSTERTPNPVSPGLTPGAPAKQKKGNFGDYVVTVGKNKGKTIKDLDSMGELSGFMWWIENKTDKPLKGELKNILEAANEYVKGQQQPPKTDFEEEIPF